MWVCSRSEEVADRVNVKRQDTSLRCEIELVGRQKAKASKTATGKMRPVRDWKLVELFDLDVDRTGAKDIENGFQTIEPDMGSTKSDEEVSSDSEGSE